MPFKHWQGLGIDHLPRKPVPVFEHPLGNEMLPNAKSKPPLEQLCAIPMHPVTGSQGEEISTSISTSPPQEAIESNESPLRLLFSKLDKPMSQDIPSSPFQPFHQLCCPPLDIFKYLTNVLKLWGPELHTVLKMRPHKCWMQQDNHLFWLAGYAVFDAPKGAVCSLSCQGTLLTHIKPAVNQHPQIPFCRAVLQPIISQFIPMPSTTPAYVQNLAFDVFKFHAIDDCPIQQSF